MRKKYTYQMKICYVDEEKYILARITKRLGLVKTYVF